MSSIADCPTPQVTPEQAGTDAANVAKGMGIQACNTSNYNLSASASLSSILGSASATFQANSTATVGCEDLVIIADRFRNVSNNVSCIINNSKSIMKTVSTAVASILVEASGKNSEIHFDCPTGGIEIKQNVSIKNITNFTASDQDVSDITNEVKSLIKSTSDVLNKDASGLGSDRHGGKTVSQMITDIQSKDINAMVKDSVKDVTIENAGGTSVIIKSSGEGSKIYLSGKSCTMDQNIVLDITSNIITSNIMNNVFKDIVDTINEHDAKVTSESTAKGVGNTFDSMYSYLTSTQLGWIIGLVVIAVVGMIAGIIYKLSSSSKPESPPPPQNTTPTPPTVAQLPSTTEGVKASFRFCHSCNSMKQGRK